MVDGKTPLRHCIGGCHSGTVRATLGHPDQLTSWGGPSTFQSFNKTSLAYFLITSVYVFAMITEGRGDEKVGTLSGTFPLSPGC